MGYKKYCVFEPVRCDQIIIKILCYSFLNELGKGKSESLLIVDVICRGKCGFKSDHKEWY